MWDRKENYRYAKLSLCTEDNSFFLIDSWVRDDNAWRFVRFKQFYQIPAGQFQVSRRWYKFKDVQLKKISFFQTFFSKKTHPILPVKRNPNLYYFIFIIFVLNKIPFLIKCTHDPSIDQKSNT